MKITDDNVIDQLIHKNTIALEYIINKYSKAVYSLTYRVLSKACNKEDIEDCVSDVFVNVWEKCYKYDSTKGNIKTWLLILTKYNALNYLRKLRQNKEVITENEIISEIASDDYTEDIILSNEAIQEIVNIIGELHDKDKDIFYLRYFSHENIESIAKTYNLTRQAVDNRLWRSRKFLYERLRNSRKELNSYE